MSRGELCGPSYGVDPVQPAFFVACAGFGDAVCNTQVGTLLGILVPQESLKVAFAVWKGLFSLACGIVFVAEPFIDGHIGVSLAVVQALLLISATGLAISATAVATKHAAATTAAAAR